MESVLFLIHDRYAEQSLELFRMMEVNFEPITLDLIVISSMRTTSSLR